MSNYQVALEICANSYQSAKNAQDGGADRVELCQNLEQGGITPSYGLIKRCSKSLTIPVHVLIRPRPGNFVYTEDEIQVMLDDISLCRQLGVAGVVIGALRSDNSVDTARTTRMVETAKPLHVTFHRAIEDCPAVVQALEDIIAAGCDRILTSGTGRTVLEEPSSIRNLVTQAKGRIEVMAGGGVTTANIDAVLMSTGVRSVHASAKSTKENASNTVPSRFDAEELESDLHQIRLIAEKLKAIGKFPMKFSESSLDSKTLP